MNRAALRAADLLLDGKRFKMLREAFYNFILCRFIGSVRR
jgi:hypothetical protein